MYMSREIQYGEDVLTLEIDEIPYQQVHDFKYRGQHK